MGCFQDRSLSKPRDFMCSLVRASVMPPWPQQISAQSNSLDIAPSPFNHDCTSILAAARRASPLSRDSLRSRGSGSIAFARSQIHWGAPFPRPVAGLRDTIELKLLAIKVAAEVESTNSFDVPMDRYRQRPPMRSLGQAADHAIEAL
eukprot:8113555-Pyramimonas_sp.AAC.1